MENPRANEPSPGNVGCWRGGVLGWGLLMPSLWCLVASALPIIAGLFPGPARRRLEGIAPNAWAYCPFLLVYTVVIAIVLAHSRVPEPWKFLQVTLAICIACWLAFPTLFCLMALGLKGPL